MNIDAIHDGKESTKESTKEKERTKERLRRMQQLRIQQPQWKRKRRKVQSSWTRQSLCGKGQQHPLFKGSHNYHKGKGKGRQKAYKFPTHATDVDNPATMPEIAEWQSTTSVKPTMGSQATSSQQQGYNDALAQWYGQRNYYDPNWHYQDSTNFHQPQVQQQQQLALPVPAGAQEQTPAIHIVAAVNMNNTNCQRKTNNADHERYV